MVRAKKVLAPAASAAAVIAPTENVLVEAKIEEAEVVKPVKRSGFYVQRKLTPEACGFFGWLLDSEHSRVDITKAINAYIRNNGLQKDPTDLRNIFPDPTLKELLLLKTDDPLMFKDVQKHYVHLFAEIAPSAAKPVQSEQVQSEQVSVVVDPFVKKVRKSKKAIVAEI